MDKLSFYDLESLKRDYQIFFDKDTRYNRKLVYTIRVNINKMVAEQNAIKEDLPKDVEGWNEYTQARFDLAIKHGGKTVQLPNGGQQITNFAELQEDAKFIKAMDKLEKENAELIEAQEKVSEQIDEALSAKIVDIELRKVNLDWFPEEITFSQMPQSLLDIIEE
jgi:hypothetical protein